MDKLAIPTLVMVAWLRGLPFITSDMADIHTIEDNTAWPASGFVHVENCIGGDINQYTGWRSSVIQLDVMAYNPNSPWPLWNTSLQLCENIIQAGIDNVNTQGVLTLPVANHQTARVSAVKCAEPFQVKGDENYARCTMDAAMEWVGL